jgi:anti-sigma B factor antagonist
MYQEWRHEVETVSSLTEIERPATGAPAVCVVRGEIDISNIDEFRAGLHDAFRDAEAVVVDLSAVTFMASAGVRALVEAGADPGRRMTIVTGPGVATVLRICGMATLVPCLADRDAAERACRG